MACGRYLAGSVLLLVGSRPSALSVMQIDSAVPGTPVAQGPQLARSRDADWGVHEAAGVTIDYPGCDAPLRPSLAKQFQATYRSEWDWRVRVAFKDVERQAYLTVGEARNQGLLRNFLAHAKNVSQSDNTFMTVVSVQLDRDGAAECEKSREKFQTHKLEIRCVDLSGWLPAAFFGKKVNAGPDTCVYNMIIWSKPEIFLTALQASPSDVLMVDTDVMIYHDLFRLGKKIMQSNPSVKVVVSHENHGRRNPNTGAVLATKTGIDLIDRWTQENFAFVNSRSGDQAAFEHLAKTAPLFWKLLGVFTPAQVGQCGIRGSWATHYNCIGGRKKDVMRNRGDWSSEANKFGQRENSSYRKRAGDGSTHLMREAYEEMTVEELRAAGEWWID